MSSSSSILLALVVFTAAWAGTGAVLRLLQRRAILDHPNERSSHVRPTPRGGGIAVVGALLPAWIGAGLWADGHAADHWAVGAAALFLAALSWLDDLRGLPASIRLLAQGAAVATALLLAPLPGPVFAGLLPGWLDGLAAGLLWVWFINLFNFMDGIDGITGVETACIGLGAALVAAVTGLDGPFIAWGLAAMAAALAFLCWNWHPARIFLGDVGSVPLGFLLGFLLLSLAARGQGLAALILPLYYLADATITLGRRLARGEKIWTAHREHFYQRAVRAGLSHAAVSRWVLAADLGLVALAVAAAGRPLAAVAGALAVVGGLLAFFATRPPAEVARP